MSKFVDPFLTRGTVDEQERRIFEECGGDVLPVKGINSVEDLRESLQDFDPSVQNEVLRGAGIPLKNRVLLLRLLAKKRGYAAQTKKVENHVEAIEDHEEVLRLWCEFSGMHALLEELRQHKGVSVGINDLSISLMNGIEKGSNQAMEGIQDSAIISAFILAFSVPVLVEPPDAIKDLGRYDYRKLMHVIGWSLVVSFGSACVLYAKIYTTATARAARASDKLRILIQGNAYAQALGMTYAVFFFFLIGLSGDAIVQYDTKEGIGIGSFVAFMFIVAMVLGRQFLVAGHLEHGWRAKGPKRGDPVDDHIAYLLLQRKATAARHFAANAWSVFDYKKGTTDPERINERGREVLFKNLPRKSAHVKYLHRSVAPEG